jgi:GNAT superfamily N-acetyltransferase
MIDRLRGYFAFKPPDSSPPEANLAHLPLLDTTFSYGGTIQYPGYPDIWERIIAGQPIPDSQRTAFTIKDPKSNLGLPFVDGAISGEHGFLDFQLLYEDILYMNHLGVEPEYRRLGVGRRLLASAEKIAQEKQLRKLWCHISMGKKEELFPMLETLGYKIVNDTNSWTYLVSKNL